MRPVPSELGRGEGCRLLVCCLVVWCFVCGAGEGCRGLVRCLMAGCFACGAGESCRLFGLLLGG